MGWRKISASRKRSFSANESASTTTAAPASRTGGCHSTTMAAAVANNPNARHKPLLVRFEKRVAECTVKIPGAVRNKNLDAVPGGQAQLHA